MYAKLWIGQTETWQVSLVPIKWNWQWRQFGCDFGKYWGLYLPLRPRKPTDFHWLFICDSEYTTECKDSVCSGPPMPGTQTHWHWWGNYSRHARRSVTNDEDDAQSSKALALVTWLSDVATTLWHVIISALLLWPPECRQDRWELWVTEEFSVLAGTDCYVSQLAVFPLKCVFVHTVVNTAQWSWYMY